MNKWPDRDHTIRGIFRFANARNTPDEQALGPSDPDRGTSPCVLPVASTAFGGGESRKRGRYQNGKQSQCFRAHCTDAFVAWSMTDRRSGLRR